MTNKTMKKESYIVCGYDIRAFLAEYDDVLVGKKKTFSAALMSKQHGTELCSALLKLIFAEYLHWTPEQIRDCLTQDEIDRMCLAPLINKIPSSPEVLRDRDLYFVAWHLYPHTVHYNPRDPRLVIKVYHDLLNGNTKKFPKGFFDGSENGQLRAKILFRIMVKEFLSGRFYGYADMCRFFASSEGTRTIERYKLKNPMTLWFNGSALDYFFGSLRDSEITPELQALYEELRMQKANSKYPRLYESMSGQMPKKTQNLEEQPDIFDDVDCDNEHEREEENE